MNKIIYIIGLTIFLSCGSDNEYSSLGDDEGVGNLQAENALLDFSLPSNFPDPTYDITQNPPTEKGFELGKKLFYDGKLASDGVVSCGFCHIQDFAFTPVSYTHLTLPTICSV